MKFKTINTREITKEMLMRGSRTIGLNNLYLAMVDQAPEYFVTVTKNEQGDPVCVSIQAEDHEIVEVLWEKT